MHKLRTYIYMHMCTHIDRHIYMYTQLHTLNNKNRKYDSYENGRTNYGYRY